MYGFQATAPEGGDVSDEELEPPSAPPERGQRITVGSEGRGRVPLILWLKDMSSWLVTRPSPSESLPRVSYSEIGRCSVSIFFTSESVLPRLSDSETQSGFSWIEQQWLRHLSSTKSYEGHSGATLALGVRVPQPAAFSPHLRVLGLLVLKSKPQISRDSTFAPSNRIETYVS